MVSAWSIPQAIRSYSFSSEQKIQPIPGPGHYNQNKSLVHNDPQYSLSKQERGQKIANINPGPGQYSRNQINVPNPSQSGIKYSIANKYQNQLPLQLVGPGSYDPKFQIQKSKVPAYKISHKNNSQKVQLTPGPGQYQYSQFSMLKNNSIKSDLQLDSVQKKGISLSKISRQDQQPINLIRNHSSQKNQPIGLDQRNNIPGPGQYQNKGWQYNRIGGIISKNLNNFQNIGSSNVPGPGAYHNNLNIKKDSGFKIPQQKRQNISVRETPGPGSYSVDSQLIERSKYSSPITKFSKEQRGTLIKKEVPGPGQYILNDFSKGNAKNIIMGSQKRSLENLNKDNPGPGDYKPSLNYNKLKVPGYKMGKEPRGTFEKNLVPGPGQYDNSSEYIHASNPKIKFAYGKRQDVGVMKTPGPGHYKLKPTFADVPKYLVKKQNQLYV